MRILFQKNKTKSLFFFLLGSIFSSGFLSCSQDMDPMDQNMNPPPPPPAVTKVEIQSISPPVVPSSGRVQITMDLLREGSDPISLDEVTEIRLNGVVAQGIQNAASRSLQFIMPTLPEPKQKLPVSVEVTTKLGHTTKRDDLLAIEPPWFKDPQAILVSLFPYQIVTGDFNGDTLLDIAVVGISDKDENASKVSILAGQAGPTFSLLPNSLDFPNTKRIQLAVAPFENISTPNRDELVILNHDLNYLIIGFLAADNSFKEQARFIANPTASPEKMQIADVTGDGKLDIILSGSDNNHQPWFRILPSQNIANQFPINGIKTISFTSNLPPAFYSYALQDVDRDPNNTLDLVLASLQTDEVYVKPGKGDGTFGPAQIFKTDPVMPSLPNQSLQTSLLLADFNGDVYPDLLVAHLNWNTSNLLPAKHQPIKDPSEIFVLPPNPSRIATNVAPHSMVTGYFHDSNILDVALLNGGVLFTDPALATFSSPNSNYGSLLVNDGKGNFSAPITFVATLQPQSINWTLHPPAPMLAIDINADKKTDLVIADYQNKSINILQNIHP